jgi:hypothetical protein
MITLIKFKQWPIDSEFITGNLPFLANLSTRQNGLFRKCAGLARLADIRQPGLLGLADISQPSLLGLARLAKAKFCKYYANLASLASLVNLASVG